MKKQNKLIATMLLVVSVVTPISTFATNYTTTEEHVDYIKNNLTQDYNNTADETKVDVLVAQASTFTVSIPKRIVLNGALNDKNDADYVVKVAGNIASDEVIHVTPATTFKMYDDKGIMPALDTTVTQSITKFVDESAKLDKYVDATDTILIKGDNDNNIGVTNGNVEVHNLTSGSWSGIFNFEIRLETTELELHSFTINFDKNSGEGNMNPICFYSIESESVTIVVPDSTFTKENYEFVEWNTHADGTGVAYRAGNNLTCYDTVTLYAQWKHIVNVVGGGGDVPDLED